MSIENCVLESTQQRAEPTVGCWSTKDSSYLPAVEDEGVAESYEGINIVLLAHLLASHVPSCDPDGQSIREVG